MNTERMAILKDKLQSWPGEMALTSEDVADLLAVLRPAEPHIMGELIEREYLEDDQFGPILIGGIRCPHCGKDVLLNPKAKPPAPTDDYREVMASYVPDGWDDLSNNIYADIKAIILAAPPKTENK